jgi:hypothetical protein
MKNRLTFAAVALGFVFALGILFGFLAPRMTGLNSQPRTVSTPTILKQIQTLSQLVTVKYVMEKIQVLEDVKLFPGVGENRVAILAHGIVEAGIDLKEMKSEDISISEKKISIRLPPARILTAHLDESQTKVLDHTTGLFRTFDKNLQQTAREQAIDDIRRAARHEGILKEADDRAREQIKSLLKQLGFDEVDFRK